MEWLLIYLFVCIEKFAVALSTAWALFWIPGIALGLLTIISVISGIADDEFEETWNHVVSKFIKSACKWLMPIGFVFGTIGHFLPSQKELAIIVGSGLTYNVLTSETGKRIGGKAVDLLEQKIDQALKAPEAKETPKVEGKAL